MFADRVRRLASAPAVASGAQNEGVWLHLRGAENLTVIVRQCLVGWWLLPPHPYLRFLLISKCSACVVASALYGQ
jgi:hypothetical protein